MSFIYEVHNALYDTQIHTTNIRCVMWINVLSCIKFYLMSWQVTQDYSSGIWCTTWMQNCFDCSAWVQTVYWNFGLILLGSCLEKPPKFLCPHVSAYFRCFSLCVNPTVSFYMLFNAHSYIKIFMVFLLLLFLLRIIWNFLSLSILLFRGFLN